MSDDLPPRQTTIARIEPHDVSELGSTPSDWDVYFVPDGSDHPLRYYETSFEKLDEE